MGLIQGGSKFLRRKKGNDPFAANVILFLKGNLPLAANTTTTANFTVPAVNSTVTIDVVSSAWAAANRAIRIGSSAGNYIVTAIPSSTQITVKNCGGTNNAASGTVISSGTTIALSIIDSSITPKTLNAYGNIGLNDTIKKYRDSSIFFDGSSDYLRALSYSDTFAGDLTAEAWMYVATSGWNGVLLSTGSTAFTLGALNNRGVFRTSFLGSNIEVGTSVPVGTFFHLAFSRSGTGGNNCKTFLNGNVIYQFTNTGTLSISNNLIIGSFDTSQYFMNGNVDSFRLTKDIGRYTANFNPEVDTYLNLPG